MKVKALKKQHQQHTVTTRIKAVPEHLRHLSKENLKLLKELYRPRHYG